MTIILSKQCESLTGSLGKGYGYCIESRRTKKGSLYHYSRRNAKGFVPPDGHWRFIAKCAELSRMRLHMVDIRVPLEELRDALQEAGHYIASQHVGKAVYDARDVLNLKTTFGL